MTVRATAAPVQHPTSPNWGMFTTGDVVRVGGLSGQFRFVAAVQPEGKAVFLELRTLPAGIMRYIDPVQREIVDADAGFTWTMKGADVSKATKPSKPKTGRRKGTGNGAGKRSDASKPTAGRPGYSGKVTIAGRGVEAHGVADGTGQIRITGGECSADITPSAPARTAEVREALRTEGILVKHGAHLRFEKGAVFASPSAASTVILGRSSNGWLDFKTPDGRTLAEAGRSTKV